jgi:hypothetical protein
MAKAPSNTGEGFCFVDAMTIVERLTLIALHSIAFLKVMLWKNVVFFPPEHPFIVSYKTTEVKPHTTKIKVVCFQQVPYGTNPL